MAKGYKPHESYVAGHGQTVPLARKQLTDLVDSKVAKQLEELKDTLAGHCTDKVKADKPA